MMIEEFLSEKRVLMLHNWTETEKLAAFTKWIVNQKYGMDTLREIKRIQDEEISEFLYEGESK